MDGDGDSDVAGDESCCCCACAFVNSLVSYELTKERVGNNNSDRRIYCLEEAEVEEELLPPLLAATAADPR